MNDKQITYCINARWSVKEIYFGSHELDNENILCFCNDFDSCKIIIDALVTLHKDRPFEYKAVKIADDYKPVLDDIFELDILSGEEIDNSIYLNGISCI